MDKQNPKITVMKTTKDQLDQRKIIDCETYDSVITRLLEVKK